MVWQAKEMADQIQQVAVGTRGWRIRVRIQCKCFHFVLCSRSSFSFCFVAFLCGWSSAGSNLLRQQVVAKERARHHFSRTATLWAVVGAESGAQDLRARKLLIELQCTHSASYFSPASPAARERALASHKHWATYVKLYPISAAFPAGRAL